MIESKNFLILSSKFNNGKSQTADWTQHGSIASTVLLTCYMYAIHDIIYTKIQCIS